MSLLLLEKESIQINQNSIHYNDIEYTVSYELCETNIMDELLPNNSFISFINEDDIIIYHKKTQNFYMIEASDNTNITQDEEDNTIGLTLELILMNINDNQPIIAKVDTGADSTTLRVSDIQVRSNPLNPDTEQVKFTFNEKTYTKNVSGYHTVKTSEGEVEHRPYIVLDVKFGDNLINNVAINLNTVNGDQQQMLAGLNLLQELDYKIDVNESKITKLDISNLLNFNENILSMLVPSTVEETNEE